MTPTTVNALFNVDSQKENFVFETKQKFNPKEEKIKETVTDAVVGTFNNSKALFVTTYRTELPFFNKVYVYGENDLKVSSNLSTPQDEPVKNITILDRHLYVLTKSGVSKHVINDTEDAFSIMPDGETFKYSGGEQLCVATPNVFGFVNRRSVKHDATFFHADTRKYHHYDYLGKKAAAYQIKPCTLVYSQDFFWLSFSLVTINTHKYTSEVHKISLRGEYKLRIEIDQFCVHFTVVSEYQLFVWGFNKCVFIDNLTNVSRNMTLDCPSNRGVTVITDGSNNYNVVLKQSNVTIYNSDGKNVKVPFTQKPNGWISALKTSQKVYPRLFPFSGSTLYSINENSKVTRLTLCIKA